MGQRGWIRAQEESSNSFFNYYEHWGGNYILGLAHSTFRRAWRKKSQKRYGLMLGTFILEFKANSEARCWLGNTTTIPDNPWIEFDFDTETVRLWEYSVSHTHGVDDKVRGEKLQEWTFQEFARENAIDKALEYDDLGQ